MAGTHSLLRLSTFLVALVALLFGTAATAPSDPPEDDGQDDGRRVRAIVDLHDDADPSATGREMAQRHDGELMFVYEHVLNGFAGVFPEGRLDSIRRDPRVESIELDQEVHAFAQTVPTGVQRIFADDNTNLDIDASDDGRVDVDVAVIDTGIDLDHPDLNVVGSVDCFYSDSGGPPWSRNYYCGAGGDDDNGHGTHVAGTIGAIDDGNGVVGVAPGARLWAVKVLDSSGSGYMSNIIAGIDWVTSTRADTDTSNDIAVANMSLGCECSSPDLDQALTDSVSAGVAYAVAAGNSSMDVADYSPAGHPDVLTVSALADFDGEPGGSGSPTCRSDEDDTFADFSNYGSGVDVIAPGVCILSTVPGGYDTYSGTSMASPHSAGALAVVASGDGLATTATGVHALYTTVESAGNIDWDASDDGDGTKEPLLDVSDTTVFAPALVSGDGGTDEPTNAAPTASFTFACTDLTCDFDASGSTDSDGSISSYSWDFGDGTTDVGAIVSHTYAAGGTYTVTLTVTDDDGATDSSSQDVSATDSSSGTTAEMVVASETYDQFGGPQSDKHLDVTITITDTSGTAVSGATVTVDLYRDGTTLVYDDLTGTTDSSGAVIFAFRDIGSGCYSADIVDVVKSGYTYDDSTDPTGSSC